jgi:hypothetical protein
MHDMRYAILKASEHFTESQKSRLILPWDLLDAAMKLSSPVHWQLSKDYWLQHRFWDSASMIAQCEALCPTEEDVQAFVQWAFGILGYQEQVDE